MVFVFTVYILIFNSFDFKVFFYDGYDPILHSLWGLQFYLFGVIGALFNNELSERKKLISYLSLIYIFIAIKYNFYSLFIANRYIYILGSYFFLFLLDKKVRFLSKVGKCSMGIYLLHAPIPLKLATLPFLFIPMSEIGQLFVISVTTYLISLSIYLLTKKIKYCRVCFGEFK